MMVLAVDVCCNCTAHRDKLCTWYNGWKPSAGSKDVYDLFQGYTGFQAKIARFVIEA